jgi:hypothetical protein
MKRAWGTSASNYRVELRRTITAIALASIVGALFVGSANAAPARKQFSAGITPGVVTAGTASTPGIVTMTVSLTNKNPAQTLGSSQFVLPAATGSGFVMTIKDATGGGSDPASAYSAAGQSFVYPCPTASSSTVPCARVLATRTSLTSVHSGSVVEFDHLALPLNQTFTATITVSVPFACVDLLQWSVFAHQANDFSSNSGNDFIGPDVNPTTTVVTACSLNWTAQPADALANATITSDAGTPTSANLITVTVQDSSGTTIVGANIPINLGLVDVESKGGALTGSTSNAVGGVATFTPSIDLVGLYQLQASSTGVACSNGASPTCGTSGYFAIVNDVQACTRGKSCSTNNSQNGAVSGYTQAPNPPVNGGHVIVAFGIMQNLNCPGYANPANVAVTFEYIPPAGSTTLTPINGTYSVPHSAINQVCFASVASFSNTKKGYGVGHVDFEGVTYTVGVLDACSKTNPAPCYLKSTGQQIDTFTIVGRAVDDMRGIS